MRNRAEHWRLIHRATSPQGQTWLFVLLVCGCMFGVTGWRLQRAYTIAFADSLADATNMARAVADHMHAIIQTADLVALGAAERIQKGDFSADTLARVHDIFVARVAAVPAIHHLVVISAAGDPLTASFEPVPRVNLADRDYFLFHRDHSSAEPLIGPPIRNRVDGHWSITVSRRVDRPDGSFGGVVVAVIDCATFAGFFAGLDLGPHGAIALLDESHVIERRPEPPEADFRTRPSAQAPSWAARPAGSGRMEGAEYAVSRRFSYRWLDGLPLVVVVEMSEDDILAVWLADAWTEFAVCTAISLALGALGAGLARQMRLSARREADARRSEERYRLLADHSSDVIVQLGADGCRHYVSPACERVLGYRPEDMVGRPGGGFTHEDDRPLLRDTIAEILQAGQAPPVCLRVRHKTGAYVWVEAAGRGIKGGDGIVFAMRDVTLRKQSEAQLWQAQRMEAVGQLTAGVAHDFNNMLQAQSGALERLLRALDGQPEALRLVRAAMTAGARGAELTNSLLSFSRQQVLRPEAVAVSDVLEQLRRILATTLGLRIALHFDIAEHVAPVLADPAHLQAALLNLALNARDAMPAGGQLTIEARNAEAVADVPAGFDPAEFLTIAVCDTGTGMSPEVLERAFEPFFTTKDIGKGSGLGLSMVQGFARQSGGTVRVHSAVGHGTRIELWLPIAHAPVAPNAPPEPSPRGEGRVLLVDDVPEIVETMADLLGDCGFDVVTAERGDRALELIAGGVAFSALVTDFAMPGFNGGELVQRARLLCPALPAIIVTGYVELDKLHDVPPGTVVIRKPVRMDELVVRLRAMIEAACLPAS